jgi:hypothetical protein
VAALLLASGIKLASADSDLLAVLHFILSYCGQQASTDVETGGLCQTLPAPARAFASTAGVALRFGSRQLAALSPRHHLQGGGVPISIDSECLRVGFAGILSGCRLPCRDDGRRRAPVGRRAQPPQPAMRGDTPLARAKMVIGAHFSSGDI